MYYHEIASDMSIISHSGLSKILLKNQPPWMESSKGERPLSRGPEYEFGEILAKWAGQKKTKN